MPNRGVAANPAPDSNTRNYPLLVASVLVALYVGAGGLAKLAGVPYVHSSFPKLGLPGWFGYFIGACEVLGAIALFVRPLSAPAALGIGIIMAGATYYHATYTPVIQAAPAFILLLLCTYIGIRQRRHAFRVREN
jgi:putative oxidoreductase